MSFVGSKASQVGAYLLIVVMGISGFTAIENQSKDRRADRDAQQVRLCDESVLNRQASRDSLVSFNNFLRSTVPPEKKKDPKTIVGLAKLNAYEKTQLNKYPALRCDSKGNIIKVPEK